MLDKSEELKPKRDPEYYRTWRAKQKEKAAKAEQPTKLDAAPVAEAVVLESQPATEVAQQPVESGHGDDNVTKPDITRPPRRLPIRTKGIWQTLPATVREDIWAREIEFDRAFSKYDGLGQYVIKAEQNGTSLQKAIESYSKLEDAIRADPIGGVADWWRAMGIDPQSATAQMAERFIPDYPKQIFEAGRAAGFEEGKVAGSIAQFAATRPDFEVLKPKMSALAHADPTLPLETLYEQARWSDPMTREEELMKRQYPSNGSRNPATQRVIDRSRMASKATLGSPSTTPKPAYGNSVSEHPEGDVRAALARQRG